MKTKKENEVDSLKNIIREYTGKNIVLTQNLLKIEDENKFLKKENEILEHRIDIIKATLIKRNSLPFYKRFKKIDLD